LSLFDYDGFVIKEGGSVNKVRGFKGREPAGADALTVAMKCIVHLHQDDYNEKNFTNAIL
jgi:hypothetical protein